MSHGPVHYQLASPRACPPHGCPLVVLVSGYSVPMVVWDATVPALVDQGFRVLRFDLYGRGRSARPRLRYTPTVFTEQLHELLAKLNLPRRFHVVASSMGGPIAAVYGARHPDAFERVVLVGPAGLAERVPLTVTLLKMPGVGWWYFRHEFRPIMLAHLQENVKENVCAYPTVLAEFHRQLAIPGTPEALFSTLHHTLLQDMTAEFEALGRLGRPTLAVWGRHDAVVPINRNEKAIRRVIPSVEFVEIRHSAHLPQLETPRAFNRTVLEFLTRR
jgi:pimeloyl-ACP methyl ester carboxylesterase